MKSQRRHELQTNVLADWLGQHIEQVRPYSKAILGVVVAILCVAAVSGFIINEQSAKNTASWRDFFAASFDQRPGSLGQVAAQHAGTDAGLWALLGEADLEQAEGLRKLYTNRDEALEHFKKAAIAYEGVQKNAADEIELRRAALFGLAQVHEVQSELDIATDYYEEVAGDLTTEIGREAQRRVELLSKAEVKRFYNWFSNQRPQPPQPPTGLPQGLNLGELPQTPDLPIPSTEAMPEPSDEQPPAATEATPTDDSAADQESTDQPDTVPDSGPADQPESAPEAAEESTPSPKPPAPPGQPE